MQIIDITLYGVIVFGFIALFWAIRYLIITYRNKKNLIDSYTNYTGDISGENLGDYFYIKDLKLTMIDKSKYKYYKVILNKRLKLTSVGGLGSYGTFIDDKGLDGDVAWHPINTPGDFFKIHLDDVIPEAEYLHKMRIEKLKRIL